jgi:hypothetical protein
MKRRARLPIAALALAAGPVFLSAPAAAQQITGATWSCSGSSNMQNDSNYRLQHRQGFDAKFTVVVSPANAGELEVGIVSEQWTFGAKTVVEYQPSATLGRDARGREVVRMTYLGMTRSSGNTKRYPDFAEGQLNYNDSGQLYLTLLVSGSGDIVSGKCYPG